MAIKTATGEAFPEMQFKARVAKMLREIQWCGEGDISNNGTCPSCCAPSKFKMEMSEHATGCALAALLRECEA